ncbi:L-fucose mutarotase [Edaphobacter acidisoli]|uniref:L-fucose mutarotase n=1 Tax=Edaphobacter acidisoli TaxID=2040573 RepID=A0A916W5J0_9BACT|nr:L-fucose mutarotase [Edaphobacter acidisoli]GGA67459.1 L-fucose mutarotase [Edaphobacter acidisoli]
MLRGISPVVSPELLKLLCEMGHGDELVLADSNFPGASMARRLLRSDGLSVTDILEGIAPLFPFETYADPLVMLKVDAHKKFDPSVEADFMNVIRRYDPSVPAPIRIDRLAFYERARNAFGVLMTGELRLYGCLIIRKGVIE